MTDTSKGIHIWFNEQYPHGYTTAHNSTEALEVCRTLVKNTGKSWSVVHGDLHWKTGKPAYYTIWTDEVDKETPQ
jgi:hypothetical protein